MSPHNSHRVPLLGRIIDPDLALLDVEVDDLSQVCDRLVGLLVSRGLAPAEHATELAEAIQARERVASTAIGFGVACPHAHVDFLDRPLVLFARLKEPLDLGAPDGIPTDLVFLLLGRADDARGHLETLMQLAKLLQDAGFRQSIHEAVTPEEAVRAAIEAEERVDLRPIGPGSVALSRQGIEERSGRFGGGVLDDLRRRLPHYGNDLRQGLRLRVLAASIFLYAACFTGAVTFGALTAAETGGAIGAFEMLVATAIGGLVCALCAGQPLVILGGTGPLLIFTALLYRLTERLGLPFLPAYAWVGLWSALFTALLALLDASVLVRYVTRFTDEVFVVLMAVIFIEEAVRKLILEFQGHTADYAAALSSVDLAAGTLAIALALRLGRRSRFLRSWARDFLADFGTVIAIAAMTALSLVMREATELSHIEIPDLETLSLHVVPLGALPRWAILAAAGPALLLTILVFLTQQITARVVNSPEHKLRKGPAYHLDLLVVGGLLAVCSLLGLPWLVAATVRSLNHVSALSSTHAEDRPGGSLLLTDRVAENRISGVLIHVLVGLSLLFLPYVHQVPMACLYGVFLYMGIVSFGGNQFFQRVTLWIQDPALYPPTHYLRRVRTGVVHAYTAIQVVCFAVLWLVKASALAIFFPLVLTLLVPLRLVLPRWFDERTLRVLDRDETPEDEAGREIE